MTTLALRIFTAAERHCHLEPHSHVTGHVSQAGLSHDENAQSGVLGRLPLTAFNHFCFHGEKEAEQKLKSSTYTHDHTALGSKAC